MTATAGVAGTVALPDALDLTAMSARLAPYLGPGARLVGCGVVGHAHGERAVVRYQVTGPTGEATTLVAKLYADPERAHRLHALLTELHARAGAGHGCAVPTPVAHLADLGMAVYLSSPGVPLDGLDRDGRMAGVVAAARWLVSLHRSEVACDRVLDLALEVENMALWGEMVAASHPRARAVVTRLVARLDRLSGTITAPVYVPIHKDFHYGHTLFDRGGLVVIDLDEVRWGDPAFDVAHYLANLSLLALRERMACAERDRLQSAFLGTYRSATGYRPDARHRFFHAYTCVKIAKQLARGRGPAPAPAGAERDHQVERILRKGLQCLPA